MRATKTFGPCENDSSSATPVKTVSSRVSSFARTLSLACVVATAACGGDEQPPPATPPPTTPPPTTPPPSGGSVTVTGSERIGWTQTVQPGQSIQQFRFAAYIDNRSRANLTSVQCTASGSPNVFNCSAALPPLSQGRRSLQLSAFDPSGPESAPSEALELNVVARMVVSAAAIPDVPDRTCADSTRESACFSVDVVVQGLEQPSSLLTTDDGRLLFIERQAEVVVVDRGSLVRSPLVPTDSGSTIQSIALAADFNSSRYVYVAFTTARDDRRTLWVARFREAGSTLAEAAVIVPDLPIANEGEVALSVGDGNDLYVALPAADAGSENAGAGMILRFDSQGAAAGAPRLASPLLAETYARPAKLAWQNGRLWLAGLQTVTASAIGRLSPGRQATQDSWALRVEPVEVSGFPAVGWGVRDLATSERGRNEQPDLFFVLDKPRSLYRLVSDETGVLTPAHIPIGSVLPEAVSVARNGVVYVAAMLTLDPSQGVILRLTPRATRRALPR